MSIKWICTGKSEHGYQYKDAEGTLQNKKVIAVDFMAEIDTASEAGAVNELFDAKPVLTEAGVTAFIGLQVYPQGFTVYMDNRISNLNATDVLDFGNGATVSVETIFSKAVGGYIQFGGGGK